MNLADLAFTRLASQQLEEPIVHSPHELVYWMAAMQAQDFAMAKWAIGARLSGSLEQDVNRAIDDGSILRTHLIRPTWHFVAPQDIVWLLELTSSQIKAAGRSRDRDLELTEAIYSKSNAIIEKSLRDGMHLTREELIAALTKANIATDQNRASHLLMRAELERIICSGASRGGKATYALLAERVKEARRRNHDEALKELARRYFTSRCPATLSDFSWWSALKAGDARQALELVKSDFNPEQIAGQTYWLPTDFSLKRPQGGIVHFLPPYDELLISYRDRGAAVPSDLELFFKSISDRGVFRPVVTLNGQVIAIWERTVTKTGIHIEIQPFEKYGTPTLESIVSASRAYGTFMHKEISTNFL
jgi:hypothetical protein